MRKVMAYLVTEDPQFLQEAEKIGLETGLTRGEEMNRIVENAVRDKNLMDLYRKIVTVQ